MNHAFRAPYLLNVISFINANAEHEAIKVPTSAPNQ